VWFLTWPEKIFWTIKAKQGKGEQWSALANKEKAPIGAAPVADGFWDGHNGASQNQKSEVRSQKSEVRSQKSEVRSQKSEVVVISTSNF
jgi:hypothetical protein